MENNAAKVELTELINFQDNIFNLARELNSAHETIEEALMIASNYWRDCKFDEFRGSFMTYSEELEDISITYKRWAETILQDHIDKTKRHLGIDPGK